MMHGILGYTVWPEGLPDEARFTQSFLRALWWQQGFPALRHLGRRMCRAPTLEVIPGDHRRIARNIDGWKP